MRLKIDKTKKTGMFKMSILILFDSFDIFLLFFVLTSHHFW